MEALILINFTTNNFKKCRALLAPTIDDFSCKKKIFIEFRRLMSVTYCRKNNSP